MSRKESRLSVRTDNKKLIWLKDYAEKYDTTVSIIVNDIIEDFINQRTVKNLNEFESREEYKRYLLNEMLKSPINKYN